MGFSKEMTSGEYAVWLHAEAVKAPSPEWQIVMLFYAALHGSNHAVYGTKPPPRSHELHERYMRSHSSIGHLFTEYEELRGLSEDARYRPGLHPMPLAKVAHAQKLCAVLMTACGL